MGVVSNKIDREKLNPGDHIYSWRNAYIYAHHGIYVGEGKIIHFNPRSGQEIGTRTQPDRFNFNSFRSPSNNPCPICEADKATSLTGVLYSCIDCFLSDRDLFLFEYSVSPAHFLAQARGGTCTIASSDSQSDVLHRAFYLLRNGFGAYNLFRKNCEDFALYCKTGLVVIDSIGVGTSGQAASVFAAASAVISWRSRAGNLSALEGIRSVFVDYCDGRLNSDIGGRRDVVKVPVEKLVTVEKTPNAELQNLGLEKEKEKGKKNEEYEKEVEDEDNGSFEHPKRSEKRDCLFYLRKGTCKFGLNCKFNHPPSSENQGEKEVNKEEDELAERQPECKYYLRNGGCKFGKACKYNHPREKLW